MIAENHIKAGAVGLLLFALHTACLAQTSSSTAAKFTIQGAAEPSNSVVIRDVLGRPCLDVEAIARSRTANLDTVDHVVSLKNNCPKLIKARVCYFNSDKCNQFDVQPYKRVDTVLGTMNHVKFFRYSIFQK